MKTKKIILIAVAVVVVAGAGIWFFAGSPAKHKVTYATANVSKGDISNSVTATGTIEPVTEVEVGTTNRRRRAGAGRWLRLSHAAPRCRTYAGCRTAH